MTGALGANRRPRSMTQDRLHPTPQSRGQGCTALSVVQISDVSQVAWIERDVLVGLSDQNDFASERMRDASFIEDVRIATCAIAGFS